MKKLNISFVFSLFLPLLLAAQNPLESGFGLLETGQFAAAESFFEAALETDPDNLTAQICYGRAVGLNGAPERALNLFNGLADRYPDNLEILLNQAESLMWGRQFTAAAAQYDRLIAQYPTNFTALLGAANARAGQFDYAAAQPLIKRALTVQPGNPSALISKKFILLGRAGQDKEQWRYAAAHHRLDSVEQLFPGDPNSRLLRGDLYLSEQRIAEAHQHFQQMVADSQNLVRAYGGLSYTSTLRHRRRAALDYAEKALATARQQGSDSTTLLRVQLQLVNALGLNRRFTQAFSSLDELAQRYPDQPSVDLARARMLLWSRDLAASRAVYDSLEQTAAEASFDLYMGLVDISRAQHEADAALAYLGRARHLQPSQPDAYRLSQQLQRADRLTLQLRGGLLQDNGGNYGQERFAGVQFGRYGRWQPFLEVSDWQAYGQDATERATQRTALAGTRYRINPALALRFSAGATVYEDATGSTQSAGRGELGLDLNLGKYHRFDAAVSRDLHNYTADLVRSGIVRNNLTLTYNFTTPGPLGLYSQYIHTRQSDGNLRNLLFTSLYYQLSEAPWAKVGLNYNTFGFAEQRPEQYFSPRTANGTEVFLQVNSDRADTRRFFYAGLIAIGIQQVGANQPQQSTRAELSLGYRPTLSWELLAKVQRGNTVQSTVSGYAFTRFGLELRYRWPVAKN